MKKYILPIFAVLFNLHFAFGQVPTITSFSPGSGAAGTTVVITGTNFNSTAANNIVYFGATKVTPTAGNTTSLTVAVPSGATFQPISVTNANLTGYSSRPFVVTFTAPGGIDNNSFQKFDLPISTNNVNSLSLGDLDGDGKIDMGAVNFNAANKVAIFRNGTSLPGVIALASFGSELDLTSSPNPYGTAIGDLDGDGKLDLVVTNNGSSGSGGVSVFRNTNSLGSLVIGSFVAQTTLTTNSTPLSIIISDLDKDGKPDLIVGSASISVFRNTTTAGSGVISFASKSDIVTGLGSNVNMTVGDLDNDGKPDLVVTNSATATNSVQIFRNVISTPGTIVPASFAIQASITTGISPVSAAIGDLDGDQKADLAISNSTDGTVGIFRNTTSVANTISFASIQNLLTSPGTNPTAIAIGDLDGDGKPEIAVTNSGSSSASVFRNSTTSGTILTSNFAKTDFATGSTPNSVVFGDWDGDGKPELLVGNFGSSTVSVFRNLVSFPPTITSFSPLSGSIGTSVTITGTNFNANKANNIVLFGAVKATVTAATTTQLNVLVPSGATFRPISVTNNNLIAYAPKPFVTTFPSVGGIDASSFSKFDLTVSATPAGVGLGDLDGDGKVDLALAIANKVPVFRNTGSAGIISAATFSSGEVDLTATGNPNAIAIGDLDRDGLPDLAVTNTATNSVSVFRNTSSSGSLTTASFGAQASFPTGSSPTAMAIADIDVDGKPDLIVVNSGTSVSIFRNISVTGSLNTGSFSLKTDITTGLTASNLAVGDIDSDGKPDLIVSNSGTSVLVFHNNSVSGSISFPSSITLTSGTTPGAIGIGDLDGDGNPDLAVTNFASASVSVFRNLNMVVGTPSFAAKVDLLMSPGINPNSIAIGDLDGDAKPDLAVTSNGSTSVSVFRNTAVSGTIVAGNFAKTDYATGATLPTFISIGDLDGDFKPDLAVANAGGLIISLFRNQVPNLPPPTISSFAPTSGNPGTSVTITGTNFNSNSGSNIVYFGAVKAAVTTGTTTQLTVTVPVGTTYQPISVTNGNLTGYSAKQFTPTFPTAGGISSSSFVKFDLTTSAAPNGVALGDLDGDGKIDLSLSIASKVPVFRFAGGPGPFASGSYANEVDLTATANPGAVAVGDLDGDGNLDLAITMPSSNTVSVFRNNNTGSLTTASFGAQANLPAGTTPSAIVISDIDGDGKPDLVVANSGSSVSVFRNVSSLGSLTSASFQTKVDITTGLTASNLAVGDVDLDGKPDLIVSSGGTSVSVFHNSSVSGSITFGAPVLLVSGTTPGSIAIGDLDLDGKADLAVTNFASASVSVFRNLNSVIGTVSFNTKIDLAMSPGVNPNSVAIGDLDGDAKPELVVTNNGSSSVSVFRNSAVSGSLVSGNFTKTDFTTGASQPTSVVIGDLDGDLKSDFAVANAGGTSVSIFRSQIANFLPPVITSFSPISGPAASSVTISGSNFSTTSANNIVYFGAAKATVTIASTNQLTVTVPAGATAQPITVTANGMTAYSTKYFNLTFAQSGVLDVNSFAPNVSFTTSSGPFTGILGDLDGDGKTDLISINLDAETVTIFKNNIAAVGPITASSFTAITPDLAVGSHPYFAALGDLDGDGKPDLAVTNAYDNTVTVLKNTSSPGLISFAAGVDFITGVEPAGVAISDLDSDGKPDLIIANLQDNTVSVFKSAVVTGINQASFPTIVDFQIGDGPSNVAVGDLDGDSKPEIVVTNARDNTVSILRNKGVAGTISQSSFDSHVDYQTGVDPGGLVIGDLDGDGKLDIAISNYDEYTISVLKNNLLTSGAAFTQNSFSQKVDFLSGESPISLAVGDLNGDGKLDLINDGNGGSKISFLKNTTTVGSIVPASFASVVDLTSASNTSVAVGDLDGDGRPEIVGTAYNTDAIVVARNLTTTGFVKPTSSPSILVFSGVTSSSLTGSFTAAPTSPTGYVVLRKVGSATAASTLPVDGTVYAANAILVDGTVAYVGSGTSWNEVGLTAGSQYFYTIFPYSGSGTSISYLTTSPLTGSQLLPSTGSLATEPSAQPTNLVFSNVATTTYSFSFTAATGSPDGYLIVVNVGSAPTGFPVDGVVYSSFPTSLTNGTGVVNNSGSPLSYNYMGAGSGVSVFFAIYAYRGSGSSINYYTISPLTGNVTTLTGTPLATAPTAQASGLFFIGITNSGYTATFNAAAVAPAGYIALRKAGSAPVSGIPIGGTTYAVGANIGDATVAFVGNALTFNETALTPATTYYYTLYAYNGSTTSINYLTTAPATGSSTTGFLQPSIISFTPSHGYVGSVVTIAGNNFSPTASNNVVDFGGTVSTSISNVTTTSITAAVPSGAIDGPITITLGTLSSTSILDFSVDVSPLILEDSSFVVSYARDQTNTVSVTVNDASFTSSVNLWTKGITSSGSYTSRVIAATGDMFSTALTASEMADPIGIHYYFEIIPIDLSASIITSTTDAFLNNPSTSSDPPTLAGLTIGKTQGSYQIISIPYTLSPNTTSSVFSALGGVDKTKWRLWAYDKNANPVPYDENPSSIVPGQGYWLIDNVAGTASFSVGSGNAVQATELSPFFIQLTAGYNLIGNPYNFNILWQDVLDLNPSIPATTQLRLFNNDGVNPGFNNGTVLPKFRGGFVNSISSVKLYFPVTRNPSAGRVGNVEAVLNSIDQPQWTVSLKLANAEISNNLAGIGMNPKATVKGMDVFDQPSLPVPDEDGFFEVVFDHPEINKTFDTEIVPTESAYTWDFEVKRGVSAGQVTMSWRNDYFGAGDRQLVLFDPAVMQFMDMRQENQYTLKESTKRLKIIYGSRDYVNSTLDRELPLMGTAYPNPAQQRVVIPFRVPLSLENADVNITIFDSQGRALSTVANGNYPKGRYEAVWTSEGGAGLYILQFKLGSNIPEYQKIIITR